MRVDYIDLLAVLRDYSKLTKVRVFGRIENEIQSPQALASSVIIGDRLKCVRMNILAVDLSKCKDILIKLGIESASEDNIFFANGSLATYVSEDTILNDWYSIEGSISLSKRTKSPVVAMFNFIKTQEGKWKVMGTPVADLSAEGMNKTGRVYDYLCKGASLNTILLPEEALSCPRCLADEPNILSEFTGVPLERTVLADTSDMSTFEMPVDTDTLSPAVGVSKSKSKAVVSKASIVGITENFKAISSAVSDCKALRKSYLRGIASLYSLDKKPSSYVEYTLNQLVSNMRKQYQYGHSGESLIKGYLAIMNTSSGNCYKPKLGGTVEQYIIGIFDKVADYAKTGVSDDLFVGADSMSVIESCFSQPEYCYAGILGQVVGIDVQALVNVAIFCTSVGISFSKLVNDNPYWLCFMSREMTFGVVEKIALCLQLHQKDEIKVIKDCAILYSYLRTFNKSSITESEIESLHLGVNFSTKSKDLLLSDRFINSSVRNDITVFIKSNVSQSDWVYTNIDWVCNKDLWVVKNTIIDHNAVVTNLCTLGFCVKLNIGKINGIFLAVPLERTVFVFNKLQTLSLNTQYHKYDEEKLDSYIEDFSEGFGISLDDNQRSALRNALNCNVSIVDGRVGSGKTDFLKCLLFIIDMYGQMNKSEDKVHSNRVNSKSVPNRRDITDALVGCFVSKDIEIPLFEDTYGIDASTLKTVFCGDKRVLDNIFLDDTCVRTIDCDWYIFNNISNYDIDTLYQILRSIDSGRVLFIGDSNTGVLDGTNSVFLDLLSILPSTQLGVSDYSLRRSVLAYVTDNVVKGSNITAGESFNDRLRFLNIEDNNIPAVVSVLSAYHSSEVGTDIPSVLSSYDLLHPTTELSKADIKVASPVTKPIYNWGSYVLNACLQDAVNRDGEVITCRGYGSLDTLFKVGDEIIVTKEMSTVQWYSSYSNGNFKKRWGYGVNEGDIGTIVDVVPAYDCTFTTEQDDKPDWFSEPYFALRSDASFQKAGNYFIVVAFKSYEFQCQYYVLFRASLIGNTRVFDGADLKNFELNYCINPRQLFTHQYKMLILALGSGNFNGYINRNLLYSLLSKGSDYIYIVGSKSQFNNAIQITAECNYTNSLLSLCI